MKSTDLSKIWILALSSCIFLSSCAITSVTKVHIADLSCRNSLASFAQSTEWGHYLAMSFPLDFFDQVSDPPKNLMRALSRSTPLAGLPSAIAKPSELKVFDLLSTDHKEPDIEVLALANSLWTPRPIATIVNFYNGADKEGRPICMAQTAGVLIYHHKRTIGAFALSQSEFSTAFENTSKDIEFSNGLPKVIHFVPQSAILSGCRCSGHTAILGLPR
jgi:hypothetical protein